MPDGHLLAKEIQPVFGYELCIPQLRQTLLLIPVMSLLWLVFTVL